MPRGWGRGHHAPGRRARLRCRQRAEVACGEGMGDLALLLLLMWGQLGHEVESLLPRRL